MNIAVIERFWNEVENCSIFDLIVLVIVRI